MKKRSNAEQIAMILATKKLSACTQIVGQITSIYRWKGKMQKTKEWLCLAKTTRAKYRKVEKIIKAIHPYKIPEIIMGRMPNILSLPLTIALPIIDESKEYLA